MNYQCALIIGCLLLLFSLNSFGQSSLGNELTEMKIEVRKSISTLDPTITETLPINKIPVLEEGESLVIKFCADCKGRKFEDLGFRKMIVFFVNPASVYADLNNNFDKAVKEIEFQTESKKKKSLLYRELEFKVPYRSIPLIFLVSNGEYRHDIKKIILEKQADVIRLGEQTNVLTDLPQVVQYLGQVKEVLNTPAAYNTRVAQSLLQRAQVFRLDRTNCFYQPLYLDERDKLECLVKNFNVAEFEKDLNSLSFDKYGKLVGQEVVSQLRYKYDGLNIFLDATIAAIELVGAMFKKKPLNIQIGSLVQNQNEYLSLRQIPVNLQANSERALLIAPLKWREKEEILTKEMLNTVEVLPDRQCLAAGKNLFWFETENPLVKKEINNIFFELKNEAKTDSEQKHIFTEIPVNLTDSSISLMIDETVWRKIRNWQKVNGKAVLKYNFETIEKDFDLNILPVANWQILRNPNETIRRSEDSVLRITPNTGKRDCLDKIVIKGAKNQEIQLTPLRDFLVEKSGIIKLSLRDETKEKLQTGKLSINIYENGNEIPAGKLSVELLDKKPQFQFAIYRGDNFAVISGDRIAEINRILVNGKSAEFDSKTKRINLPDAITDTQVSFDIQLKAGDSISQIIETFPSRPKIAGELICPNSAQNEKQNNENQSYFTIGKKQSYKQYELENCVYPADTDEIKFILVSGEDYSFSLVNKPTLTMDFGKDIVKDNNAPILPDAGNKPAINTNSGLNSNSNSNLINIPAQILSPKRLDATLKIDAKIKEQLEDGNNLFIKITDPVRGASDWYPIKVKFLRLPTNLQLNCVSSKETAKPMENKGANKSVLNQPPSPVPNCELSGNLSMLESIFVTAENGKEIEYPVNITSDKITISDVPVEKTFYIRLRGYEPKIKVNLTANSQTPILNSADKPVQNKPSEPIK